MPQLTFIKIINHAKVESETGNKDRNVIDG